MPSRRILIATFTPFTSSGGIDTAALQAMIGHLRETGVAGFAPTGTTGEFLLLSAEEKALVHGTVLKAAAGLPVVPNVWDPDPNVVLQLARAAADRGAHAVFLPPPIYHPVSAEVLVSWYARVVQAVPIPVWAYHHPRTGNPIDDTLIGRLREAGVAGMKDSSGEPARVKALAEGWPDAIWAGGDPLLAMGHDQLGPIAGYISRYAALYPETALAITSGVWTAEAGAAQIDSDTRAIAAAGGLPAMKQAMGLGNRYPVVTSSSTSAVRAPNWVWERQG